MKLNRIRDNPGSRQAPKRLGRGIGSGLGKTSGRGGKGQTARSGVSLNGFEGGQTPLHRRLPKRGFVSVFRVERQIVPLARLRRAVDDKRIDPAQTVSAASLAAAGVIRRPGAGIRLLGGGELGVALTIEAAGASASARAAVEKAGGKIVSTIVVRDRVVKDAEAKQAKRAKRLAKSAKGGGAKAAAASEEGKKDGGEKAAKSADKPAKPAAAPKT